MHLNLTLSTLANVTEGRLTAQSGAAVINEISIDTRTLKRGAAYIALKGQKYDGHSFIAQAAQNGAALIIAQEGRAAEFNFEPGPSCALLEVKDTLKALQALSAFHRQRFPIKIAAVTGSNGKSTTKQMLYAILSQEGKTAVSAGNLNNHIGVPMSLLEITKEHAYGVFEMGASKKGDIEEVASIIRPDVAVITNISPAHLEFFGDIETIYQTKTEVIKHLNPFGTLVYNADDKMLGRLAAEYNGKALTFGFGGGANARIEQENPVFAFTYKDSVFRAPVAFERHNKLNAAAACLAAVALGLFKEKIESGLASYEPMPLRLEERQKGKTLFILDCYNANPVSMENALNVLAAKDGPRAAVLGDMKELGRYSAYYHRQLAYQLEARGIANIYLIGPEIKETAQALAQTSCVKEGRVMLKYSLDINGLMAELKLLPQIGGTVLIKASRALNFEQIFDNI